MVKLNINVEFQDCDDETIGKMSHYMTMWRDAFALAVEQNGHELAVTKTVTEEGSTTKMLEITPEVKLQNRIMELERETDTLKQMLLDADEVARLRGDKHGLCDSFANSGEAYPSATCANWLDIWKKQGRRAMLLLSDLK